MLAAEPYMIVFRFLHILGGVMWVGSTFLLTLFIGPSAAELGPAAGPMLHKLVVERRVTQVITTIAIVTVTAGLFVYWHDVQAYDSLGDFVGTRLRPRAHDRRRVRDRGRDLGVDPGRGEDRADGPLRGRRDAGGGPAAGRA